MSEIPVLRSRLQEDMKAAMRSRDQAKLGTIRLILAAIKQKEIDERITLTDQQIVGVLDKMIKQSQDSIEQYTSGNRLDLVNKEAAEIVVIKQYLPQPLSQVEIDELISEAMYKSAATSVKDMAKVMAYIKNKAQGQADMGKISGLVKIKLEEISASS